MMKKLIFLAPILLFVACNGAVREEVSTTFPDGSPELVYLVKGKEEAKQYVGERRYYPNGKKHSDIRYAAELGSCAEGEFFYPDGSRFAQKASDGTWSFCAHNSQNQDLELTYDSLLVQEMSTLNLPVEVVGHRGDSAWVFRFYEDFLPQSTGLLVGGKRQGKWQFFYPNGQVQVEAIYRAGVEDGAYRSYRENGVPYFLGLYIGGQRAGIWEFYDQEGNLSGRKNYDEQ